ncbi:hypothetical protein KIP76_15780, partial [Pseudomonas aeruginosa]|nr:hypothetical protein [Pseudomonas aeruginosa]
LHKDMTKAEARLADNGSEQTVDRLHKDMTKAEARLADNGYAPVVPAPVGRMTPTALSADIRPRCHMPREPAYCQPAGHRTGPSHAMLMPTPGPEAPPCICCSAST